MSKKNGGKVTLARRWQCCSALTSAHTLGLTTTHIRAPARPCSTLPTIKDVRHVNPNTPWRTVADPLQSFKRRKKRAARAPTPHELELDVAAAEEEEEEQVAATADEAEGASASPADSDEEAEQQAVELVGGEQEQQPAERSDSEDAAPQAQRPLPPERCVTRSQITASLPATRSRTHAHLLPKGLESTGKSKRRRR